jgi:biopolymer transport protein ExbD
MSLLAHKRRKRPEMNLVPLIDVLVMLIFFAFVTMQFKSAATLNITLPKVETAGKNEFHGNVTVSIDKEGKLTLQAQAITDEELLPALRKVKDANKDTVVLIRSDEDTPLKRVILVWDACRKVGLNKQHLQSR